MKAIQGYNAQAAVDGHAQVIVAQTVTPMAADVGHLVPLVTAVTKSLHRRPRRVLADAGYCSEATLQALEGQGIDGYIATGRLKHTEWQAPAPRGRPPPGLARRERMARTLRTLKAGPCTPVGRRSWSRSSGRSNTPGASGNSSGAGSRPFSTNGR